MRQYLFTPSPWRILQAVVIQSIAQQSDVIGD